MDEAPGDRETSAWLDEPAQLGALDLGQERHPLELLQYQNKVARGLRHAFHEKHAGQDGIALEMPFEDRRFGGNQRRGANHTTDRIDLLHPINKLEVFEAHPATRVRSAG